MIGKHAFRSRNHRSMMVGDVARKLLGARGPAEDESRLFPTPVDEARDLSCAGPAKVAEKDLERTCRIAARLFEVPIALITWIDGSSASPFDACNVNRESMLIKALFDATIVLRAGEALVLTDLDQDSRFASNIPLAFDPRPRFYAGAPVSMDDGRTKGVLSLMDVVARTDFRSAQTKILQDFVRIIEGHSGLCAERKHDVACPPEGGTIRSAIDIRQRYDLLAENATDVIIHAGLDTVRRYVSPASRAVFGYDPQELLGTSAFDQVHPDDAPAFQSVVDELISGNEEKKVWRQRYRRIDGSWIWMEASARLTRDAVGEPDGYVVCLRDINDRKSVEDALRDSEERLALALEGANDGVWDFNPVTGEIGVFGAWVSLMGYSDGELPHDRAAWVALTHPQDRRRLTRTMARYLQGRFDRFECEYRLRNKSGAYVWLLARGKIVARDDRGRPVRVVGTSMDLSRRQEAERLVAHVTKHDGLTGLANRSRFKDQLRTAAEEAASLKKQFALLACDLDGFKAVNDSLGHRTGDVLLKRVADLLKGALSEDDIVARLGADEFAFILRRLERVESAAVFARGIIEAVGEPVEIDGHPVSVGMSIGIAFGDANIDVDGLFSNADVALCRAKESGGNTFRLFETGMDDLASRRGAMANDLRTAIRAGAFAVEFQPIVELETGSVCCLEALLRWNHPQQGRIPPLEFVPIAESTGLIVNIGEWVLREACREAVEWPQTIRVAVNVSAVQFRRPGSLEQSVLAALAASGLPPDRLELEITESVLMQDADTVLSSLHRLRSIGVRISLDDFGTGYSSLSYLRRFPFNKIKIDRSFVIDIENPETAAIVRAVVGLGCRAGAAITAEGVETQNQLERVRELGCTEIQGYLISRPLSPENALAWTEARSYRRRGS